MNLRLGSGVCVPGRVLGDSLLSLLASVYGASIVWASAENQVQVEGAALDRSVLPARQRLGHFLPLPRSLDCFELLGPALAYDGDRPRR